MSLDKLKFKNIKIIMFRKEVEFDENDTLIIDEEDVNKFYREMEKYERKTLNRIMNGRESVHLELVTDMQSGESHLELSKEITQHYNTKDREKTEELIEKLMGGNGRRFYSLEDLAKDNPTIEEWKAWEECILSFLRAHEGLVDKFNKYVKIWKKTHSELPFCAFDNVKENKSDYVPGERHEKE